LATAWSDPLRPRTPVPSWPASLDFANTFTMAG
jgi:hypothetical protein